MTKTTDLDGTGQKTALSSHRRPHTKSRSGCTRCKQRKVKCKEEHPSCSNCTSRGMACEYPLDPSKAPVISNSTSRKTNALPVHILPQPSTRNDKPFELTYSDLRFLHHFLTVAYPHLPAGNESIWLHDVSRIAEERPFLMHAILGLGGSHLATMRTPLEALSATQQPSFSTTSSTPASNSSTTSASSTAMTTARALHHRSLALAGLSHALTLNDWSLTAVDSMLAAAYALTFQALYLPHDGLVDFMTMVRGCALITRQIVEGQQAGGMDGGGLRSSFGLDPLAHVTVLEAEFLVREVFGSGNVLMTESDERGADLVLDGDTVDEGLSALDTVREFLERLSADPNRRTDQNASPAGQLLHYHSVLTHTLAAHKISLREAYIRYTSLYEVWWQSNTADFELLTDLGVTTQTGQAPHIGPRQNSGAALQSKGNLASMVLMMWFLALDLLLTPVFEVPYRDRRDGMEAVDRRVLVTVGWMRGLEARSLDGRQRRGNRRSSEAGIGEMISWPMTIAKKAEEQALQRLRSSDPGPS